MPAAKPISDSLRLDLIRAWYSDDAVSEIAKDLGCSTKVIYHVWAQAKRRNLLPNRPRSSGHVYPENREYANDDRDIRIPDKDPLLSRLFAHHRPGHGDMVIASAPVIVSPPPW